MLSAFRSSFVAKDWIKMIKYIYFVNLLCFISRLINLTVVVLGGMISVLATRTQVRGLNPGRGQ
jgi:hypothetical protein